MQSESEILKIATARLEQKTGVQASFVDLEKVQAIIGRVCDAIAFEGLKASNREELRAFLNGVETRISEMKRKLGGI